MKFLILSACVAAASAGVLVSNAPAHHFQAATAPAAVEQFPAAAPAALYTAGAPYAAAYTNGYAPAAAYTAGAPHAAYYTAPNLAPYASSYTVKGAALGGVPA